MPDFHTPTPGNNNNNPTPGNILQEREEINLHVVRWYPAD